MNKIIVLLVIIGVIAGLYALNNRPTEIVKTPESEQAEAGEFKPDPSNATFIFSDAPLTLSNGRAEISISESALLKEEVELTKTVAYGDINGDNKNDAVVILARFGGGSGFFIYIAPFLSGSGAYEGGNAVFLGDRIVPQEISIDSGIVTVKYLDRGANEPFAAEPTVASSKQFKIRSGILEEI